MNVQFFVITPFLFVVALMLLLWGQSLRRRIRTLQARIQDLQEQNYRLLHSVATDSLTGLLNRRAFGEAFDKVIDSLPEEGDKRQPSLAALAIFFIDLDHFKSINDTFGHTVGDEVLRRVAKIIKHTLRASDILCRWGGEEMVAVLPAVRVEQAVKIANAVREAVSAIIFAEDALHITASIGVTVVTSREDPEVIINRADKAVYDAKAGGRNRVCMR